MNDESKSGYKKDPKDFKKELSAFKIVKEGIIKFKQFINKIKY